MMNKSCIDLNSDSNTPFLSLQSAWNITADNNNGLMGVGFCVLSTNHGTATPAVTMQLPCVLSKTLCEYVYKRQQQQQQHCVGATAADKMCHMAYCQYDGLLLNAIRYL
jgi:hypothetical protein